VDEAAQRLNGERVRRPRAGAGAVVDRNEFRACKLALEVGALANKVPDQRLAGGAVVTICRARGRY
jgi:hypothetical protein